MSPPLDRRTLLCGIVLGATGACAGPPDPTTPSPGPTAMSPPTSTIKNVLVVYFSRPGENYYYGGRRNLKTGNTQVVAQLIGERLNCDVHRVEAADPYPQAYAATVERNVREQDTDARPAIAHPLTSVDRYDTVLLGSPIWNVRAPMIMTTFTESLDLSGKTVHPFTTFAMSGLGTTERDYAASCRGASIGEGLAVQGEEARDAGPDIEAWLRRISLLP